MRRDYAAAKDAEVGNGGMGIWDFRFRISDLWNRCALSIITPADKYPRLVIPAQAGIQQNTGCRIKPGMTALAI